MVGLEKTEEKKPGASYTPTNPNTGKESENKSWFPKPSLPAWMKPEPKPKTTPAQPSMWTKTKKNTKAAWDKDHHYSESIRRRVQEQKEGRAGKRIFLLVGKGKAKKMMNPKQPPNS